MISAPPPPAAPSRPVFPAVIELPTVPRSMHPDAKGLSRADSLGAFSSSGGGGAGGGPRPADVRCYTAFDYIFSSAMSGLQYPPFFSMCRMKVCAEVVWWCTLCSLVCFPHVVVVGILIVVGYKPHIHE